MHYIIDCKCYQKNSSQYIHVGLLHGILPLLERRQFC